MDMEDNWMGGGEITQSVDDEGGDDGEQSKTC